MAPSDSDTTNDDTSPRSVDASRLPVVPPPPPPPGQRPVAKPPPFRASWAEDARPIKQRSIHGSAIRLRRDAKRRGSRLLRNLALGVVGVLFLVGIVGVLTDPAPSFWGRSDTPIISSRVARSANPGSSSRGKAAGQSPSVDGAGEERHQTKGSVVRKNARSSEDLPAHRENSASIDRAQRGPTGVPEIVGTSDLSVHPPKAKPTQPNASQKLTNDQLTELANAIGSARSAIQQNRMDDAEKIISRARLIARSGPRRSLVERLEAIRHYVSQFWRAFDEGVQRLDAGAELKTDQSIFAVVEITDQALVLRSAGQNRTYSIDSLPASLRVAVARHWLDPNDPVTSVVIGAYLWTEDASNMEQVQRLWRKAQELGMDLGDLPRVLEDRYDW